MDGKEATKDILLDWSSIAEFMAEHFGAPDPLERPLSKQVADTINYYRAQDGLLSKAQADAERLGHELAECKRPLEAEMARLNANVVKANERADAAYRDNFWIPGKVKQTVLGPEGNCFSACVASYFNLPIEAVPDVSNCYDDTWCGAVRAWAELHGYGFEIFGISDDYKPSGYQIVSGDSPRELPHACIYFDGELFHDPHPDGTGLVRVLWWDHFYLLRPRRL